MNLENQVVIDVEVEQIDTQSRESIERWYSTAQVQRILGLNKSAATVLVWVWIMVACFLC
jgi:hypothetical protein